MGYFCNGSAGEGYMSCYCWNCKNWRQKKGELGIGCPVWDLHLLYSYELCNSKSKAKKMLDFLIPWKNSNNQKCSMFSRRRKDGQSMLDVET